MQETGNPPDPGFIIDFGFVVEWQLPDDTPALIDLSEADSEVILPDEAIIDSSSGRTAS